MLLDDYQQEARKTAAYREQDRIIYPALGLGGEAGEVLNKVKKVLRDNDGDFSIDEAYRIADELGDVLWYVAVLADDLGISLDVVAQRNLTKLKSRQERCVIHGEGDGR
jgi:NTP pyrophosphatase (non-canonical NTP hydrolase)